MKQLQRWEARIPPKTNAEGERTPDAYKAVIAALDVTQQRYTVDSAGPYAGQTHCNIFVWDVTSAMGCEVPHNVADFPVGDKQPGDPMPFGAYGSKELTANALVMVNGWLDVHGPRYGWKSLADGATARGFALCGEPCIVGWHNPAGHGHIAMVVPAPVDAPGVFIAQAGKSCFVFGSLASGFGDRPVRYWRHA